MGFNELRRKETAWQKKYDADAPKAGDAAPDFELSDTTGNTRIRLIDYLEERPVALIFGSYT